MRRMFGRYEANDQAEEDMQTEENRVTGSLAGLAFALFLVVVGLYLVQNLASKARLEDCLLSGRVNCDAMLSTIR